VQSPARGRRHRGSESGRPIGDPAGAVVLAGGQGGRGGLVLPRGLLRLSVGGFARAAATVPGAVEEGEGAESGRHVVLDAFQELDEGGTLARVLLPAPAHQLMAAGERAPAGFGGAPATHGHPNAAETRGQGDGLAAGFPHRGSAGLGEGGLPPPLTVCRGSSQAAPGCRCP